MEPFLHLDSDLGCIAHQELETKCEEHSKKLL